MTASALQDVPRGGPGSVTGFVAKVSPLGQTLVWSTYLGGSGWEATGGIALDGQTNVGLAGFTWSLDDPVS